MSSSYLKHLFLTLFNNKLDERLQQKVLAYECVRI
jgi:hypothetical protein